MSRYKLSQEFLTQLWSESLIFNLICKKLILNEIVCVIYTNSTYFIKS